MRINIIIEADIKNASDIEAVKEIAEAFEKIKCSEWEKGNSCEGKPDDGLPYRSKSITLERFHGLMKFFESNEAPKKVLLDMPSTNN